MADARQQAAGVGTANSGDDRSAVVRSGERDERFWEAILAADHAASVAHDFIWGKNDVTREQADVAIWAIHTALRPFIDFEGGDVAGYLEGREGDPDLADRLRNIDAAALRNYLAKGKGIDE